MQNDYAFGNSLADLRRRAGLTQRTLGYLLGVSDKAVSKWELGEGYPEVDKLLLLSKTLDASLDSLLGENAAAPAGERKASDTIRIISPNEGVTISASKVSRSRQFRGGKNSPKYALFASERSGNALLGAQNTFLAWYRSLEDVTRELAEIQTALEAGAASYTLRYSVKCKQNLLRTIED